MIAGMFQVMRTQLLKVRNVMIASKVLREFSTSNLGDLHCCAVVVLAVAAVAAAAAFAEAGVVAHDDVPVVEDD